ncbi:Outer membrane protein beta-barrel domain-containing protein [Cyclobacterium xiamenense]|uniref:Outer membrane protein beta-barrel domain-containing protein n=1 Tax=Cyclobacterium xiamenense TaxID=1297121 RepID=A0A1H6XTL7_9BACT|nr:outer membrane beta-barrel protein [Cyclobacterium xiamenense]SEJ30107.1 Outer membrane protein beta-barrel domain-containing protein [Cyclobacterium xiamenense]
MKILWPVLFLFILLSGSLLAQTSVGFRAGYTESSASYRVTLGSFPRTVTGVAAPTYSLVIEQFFEKNAGAQVEFQLLTTGYAATDTINTGNETQFDYLKIPILSNFYLGNSGRFHIKLGPHIGYLLDARDVSRVVEGELVIPTYGQPDDRPRKVMYGLTAGVGLSKLFGKHTLQGEVRYSYEFGRPESQERIFDINFTQLEFSLAYLFRVLE